VGYYSIYSFIFAVPIQVSHKSGGIKI